MFLNDTCYPRLLLALLIGISVIALLPFEAVASDTITTIMWSPNGQLIAFAHTDGVIEIYDASSDEIIQVLIGHTDSITDMAWRHDATQLASASIDETVRIWDVTSGEIVHILPHDDLVLGVIWSLDGTKVITGTAQLNSNLHIWDSTTGILMQEVEAATLGRMAWSADGVYLASASPGFSIEFYDASTFAFVQFFDHPEVANATSGHVSFVNLIVEWNPVVSNEIASGSMGGIVRVWDSSSGQIVLDLRGNDETEFDFDRSPIIDLEYVLNGEQLASISGNGTIRIWDAATGEILADFYLNGIVFSADWSPDGRWIAYSGSSEMLNIIPSPELSACDTQAESITTLVNAIVAANDSGVPTSICLVAGNTYTLIDQLPDITGNITIEGNGATLQRESTAPQFRLLEVEATGVLTLNDLTLTGGDHSGAGGALQNEGGQVVINNVTFSNNHSDTTGGAIDQLETEGATGSMTINDSTFINNSATYAGAIDNDRGNVLTINNSVFTGNQAQFYAGAIHNDDATLTINDSQFSNNSAPETGGAIKSDDESMLIITNSTLDHNTAGDGAAIRNSGSLTITGTQITDNTATDWGGGLFSSSSGTVDITGTTFSGNTAVDGGAIRNHGHLTLTQSTVESNSASDNGGAFVVAGASSTTLTDCQVLNNSAAIDGGAIHSADSSSTVTIDDSVFTGNTATEDGGAIHVQPGVFIITDSQFTLNHAGDDGGAIYDNGSTTISGSEFGNNSADDGGGAIRVNENVSITSSYLHDNSAGGSGGAVDNNDTLTITDSEIANNQAVTRGGAVYNSYGGTATVNNSCITGNATISVESSSSVDPDFTNNWWGAADGPSGDGPGSGDSIDDDVLYVPFITTGCPH